MRSRGSSPTTLLNHTMTVSKLVRLVALTAIAGVLAACGDVSTAPTAAKAPEKIRIPFDVQLAPAAAPGLSLDLAGSVLPEGTTTITIDPSQTKFYLIGAHWLYVPAGSVCSLTSSYGPTEWNKDCVPATAPITVQAKYGTVDGKAYVDFGTNMRFRPASSPLKWVALFLREPNITDLSKYNVFYRTDDGTLINEAAVDRDVRALRLNGTYIVRRVKHFSGYVIRLGNEGEGECTPEMEMDGLCSTGGTQ